jgi:hypothetical protein
MSYRTAPLTYRTGGVRATSGRSTMASTAPCKWCGRLAGLEKGDIFHYDVSPGGRSWAEHQSCRPKPSRDWLAEAPWRIP